MSDTDKTTVKTVAEAGEADARVAAREQLALVIAGTASGGMVTAYPLRGGMMPVTAGKTIKAGTAIYGAEYVEEARGELAGGSRMGGL